MDGDSISCLEIKAASILVVRNKNTAQHTSLTLASAFVEVFKSIFSNSREMNKNSLELVHFLLDKLEIAKTVKKIENSWNFLSWQKQAQ